MREHDQPRFDPEKAAFDLQLGWAQKHSSKGGGFIGVMDPSNPEYPSRLHTHIEGIPQPPEIIDAVTDSAPGPIHQMREQMLAAEAENEWISMTGDLLAAGHSVVMVTNHTDLVDVAYAHSLISSQIMRQQALKDPNSEFTRSVIINGMVEFMDFDLVDARITGINALKMLETDIYLSFPNTDSFEQKVLEITNSESERRALRRFSKSHNRAMRYKLQADLHNTNMFLAVAASGTTDDTEIIMPESPLGYDETEHGMLVPSKRIHMGPAGTKTKELLTGIRPGPLRNTEVYVLPVAVYYERQTSDETDSQPEYKQVVFKIASHPQLARNPDSIDYAMALNAETLTEETDEFTEFDYPIAA